MTEIRVIDPDTGGEKGEKDRRFDMIPPEVLAELADHFGRGEAKYPNAKPEWPGQLNYQRGLRWHLSYAALLRHLLAWGEGEDVDEETGTNHLIAVAWHAFALRWFQIHDRGTDDIAGRQQARGLAHKDTRLVPPAVPFEPIDQRLAFFEDLVSELVPAPPRRSFDVVG